MKKLGILIIVALILTGGYLLLRNYSQPKEFTAPESIVINQATQEKVDEIRMVFSDESQIILKKSNGQWTVNDLSASMEQISRLFAAFMDAKVTSRVSSNSLNHDRFEVGSEGVELTLSSGSEIIEQLIIGKSAGGNSVYIREKDDDSVYVMDGLPGHFFTEDEANYRSRKIVNATAVQVRAVKYSGNFESWEVKKTDGKWFIQTGQAAPAELDTDKTLAWLESLTAMQAAAFPEEGFIEGISLGTFSVETGSEEEYAGTMDFRINESTDESLLAVKNSEDLSYLVQKSSFEEAFAGYQDLLDRLEPGIEVSTE